MWKQLLPFFIYLITSSPCPYTIFRGQPIDMSGDPFSPNPFSGQVKFCKTLSDFYAEPFALDTRILRWKNKNNSGQTQLKQEGITPP